MPNGSPKIKRQPRRVDVNLQVGFIYNLNYKLTHATQISEAGMRIFAEGTFEKQAQVQVSFILPTDGKQILLNGEIADAIITHRGFQFIDVRFVDVSPNIRRQIRYFMENPE
jgi:hypothetical protein